MIVNPPVTIWDDESHLPYRAFIFHCISYGAFGYDEDGHPLIAFLYALN